MRREGVDGVVGASDAETADLPARRKAPSLLFVQHVKTLRDPHATPQRPRVASSLHTHHGIPFLKCCPFFVSLALPLFPPHTPYFFGSQGPITVRRRGGCAGAVESE